MVGDENGANAGISGITDLAEKSVRLFAGSTATERNIANWKMRDDGVEEQRNRTEQLLRSRCMRLKHPYEHLFCTAP